MLTLEERQFMAKIKSELDKIIELLEKIVERT